MANYNPASAAGMIFPIVGAGIGIGVLAHTAKNVTRMTDSMYRPSNTRRRTQRPKKLKFNPPKNYRWKY